MVNMSISRASALSPSAMPPASNTALRTMAAGLRLVVREAAPRAACAALPGALAPSATSGSRHAPTSVTASMTR
jgi:hypothetical protein